VLKDFVINKDTLCEYIMSIISLSLCKKYPIPTFAIIGLLLGAILHYGFKNEQFGHLVWFIVLIIGGLPIIYETIRGLAHRRFVSDIVATLAIITAIVTNEAFPGVIIVIMQSGGKALEDHAFRKATNSLDELMARSPKIAHRKINDRSIEDIDVKDIRIGDHLVIRPGDLIPTDGVIISGNAQIDESSVTGEPSSKFRKMGEEVSSGTVNIGNAFEIQANQVSEESQYSKIVKLVKKAREDKAPIQRIADKYALLFTPITLSMCGLGWILTQNPHTVLAVLVVATPCPLIFATPVGIISGINKASRQSIIVKSGAAIEQIDRAQVVVFDKTGTITHGVPIVEDVLLSNNYGINADDKSKNLESLVDNILFKSASLEQMSSHPTAQAITSTGRKKFHDLPLPENFCEEAGQGVKGIVNGEQILVGSPSFIQSQFDLVKISNVPSSNDDLQTAISDLQNNGKMVVLVNVNGDNLGIITLSDKIREGVVNMIQDLRKSGIKKTIMLTGDGPINAKSIASQVGVDQFKYDLLPEDKVNEVKKLNKDYKSVIMVGDGINDAPALTAATVGIAMGAKGTAISAEAADVVLLVDDLTKVSNIIQISRRTLKIVKQSIFVGMGLSFLLMVIASLGLIPPSIGALLQEALDVGVILNALRAR
jgi:heavy metal translocating P-type ATPase